MAGFDAKLLRALCPFTLRTLKIPLQVHMDCVEIAALLVDNRHLRSLSIIDIPDDNIFLGNLDVVGRRISCCQSLEHLELVMTNYNRPHTWDADDSFVKPPRIDYHFSVLFPQPSPEAGDRIDKCMTRGMHLPEEWEPP